MACPRHTVQRQFVKSFLIPVQQISNPVDLRGESGKVVAYSLTREEVFAESKWNCFFVFDKLFSFVVSNRFYFY